MQCEWRGLACVGHAGQDEDVIDEDALWTIHLYLELRFDFTCCDQSHCYYVSQFANFASNRR